MIRFYTHSLSLPTIVKRNFFKYIKSLHYYKINILNKNNAINKYNKSSVFYLFHKIQIIQLQLAVSTKTELCVFHL
jgi:hypothetical protein